MLSLSGLINKIEIEIEYSYKLGKSDHSLIKVQYRDRADDLPKKTVCDYEKADYQKTKLHLSIDWTSLLKRAGEDIKKHGISFSLNVKTGIYSKENCKNRQEALQQSFQP